MAESFFAALKNERIYRTVYATKVRAHSDIIRYIDDAHLANAEPPNTNIPTDPIRGDASPERAGRPTPQSVPLRSTPQSRK